MNNRIFYHKRTGEPVQIIVHAQTKPNFQEVICYQELTKPFACYVMEKRQFFAEYVTEFTKLPLTGKVPIEKREDLPDKQPRISKGKIMEEETEEETQNVDSKMAKLLAFLDAETYRQKMICLENMKDDLDEHMINNIAVSLDLSIENGMDAYQTILSELKIREKYESDRGE